MLLKEILTVDKKTVNMIELGCIFFSPIVSSQKLGKICQLFSEIS
jgi:hypothetical protein